MTISRNEGESADERIYCGECFGGFLKLHRQSFIYWTGKELINIPNFPARQCDLCGWREYDARAIYWFQKIYGGPIDADSGFPGQGRDDHRGPFRQLPE